MSVETLAMDFKPSPVFFSTLLQKLAERDVLQQQQQQQQQAEEQQQQQQQQQPEEQQDNSELSY